MALGSQQDLFNCLICKKLLKDPVTIPCRHSCCRSCIKNHLDNQDHRKLYRCPQCREIITVEELKKAAEIHHSLVLFTFPLRTLTIHLLFRTGCEPHSEKLSND
uniref:RING-type domain-containing protein n=1 Tax=Anabas testudineus TaxID=64144 RepID=A0A7N6BYR7_ANATE